MGGNRHTRKLSNLLLNRSFQLKYVGMVVGLSVLLSLALGTFLLLQVWENSRMLRLEAEYDPLFQQQLAQSDSAVLWTMILALLAFNLLLAAITLVVTHRMAGPIFVFHRIVKTLADGRLPQVRQLRRGDEFVELWEQLRRFVDVLEERTQRDVELLRRAVEDVRHGDGPDPVTDGLQEVLNHKQLLLGSPPPGDSGPSLDRESSTA